MVVILPQPVVPCVYEEIKNSRKVPRCGEDFLVSRNDPFGWRNTQTSTPILAYTPAGKIVGEVTLAPADDGWGNKVSVFEIAVQVSSHCESVTCAAPVNFGARIGCIGKSDIARNGGLVAC